MSRTPHFGHTKTGLAVHARTIDHHKGGFNKAIAVLLTAQVGKMPTFWYFCALALLSLPATLHEAGVVGAHWLGIPSFFLTFGFIFLDAWVCQNFIQLVLLPALMVGQNLQNDAADARSAKTFEDVEQVLDLLDTHTKGGLADLQAHLTKALSTLSSQSHAQHEAVMETLGTVLKAHIATAGIPEPKVTEVTVTVPPVLDAAAVASAVRKATRRKPPGAGAA